VILYLRVVLQPFSEPFAALPGLRLFEAGGEQGDLSRSAQLFGQGPGGLLAGGEVVGAHVGHHLAIGERRDPGDDGYARLPCPGDRLLDIFGVVGGDGYPRRLAGDGLLEEGCLFGRVLLRWTQELRRNAQPLGLRLQALVGVHPELAVEGSRQKDVQLLFGAGRTAAPRRDEQQRQQKADLSQHLHSGTDATGKAASSGW
jgi:hypothetical protein